MKNNFTELLIIFLDKLILFCLETGWVPIKQELQSMNFFIWYGNIDAVWPSLPVPSMDMKVVC